MRTCTARSKSHPHQNLNDGHPSPQRELKTTAYYKSGIDNSTVKVAPPIPSPYHDTGNDTSNDTGNDTSNDTLVSPASSAGRASGTHAPARVSMYALRSVPLAAATGILIHSP